MGFLRSLLGSSTPPPPPPERKPASDIQLFSRQPISLEIDLPEVAGTEFSSLILSFQEGSRVVVSVPVQPDGTEVVPAPRTAVSFSTTQMDGVRTFSSYVLESGDGAGKQLVLAWPDGFSRLNRRDAIRIPAEFPVDVTFSAEGSGPTLVRGTTLNVSEGGMRLVTSVPIPEAAQLSVRLHLPGGEPHVCGGTVLRAGENSVRGDEKPSYWAGVGFLNLSDELRKDLRQYIWDRQREILRRPAR